MNYSSLNSMWDVAHTPAHFSQLPEDDFLALLHKQFSPTDSNDHSPESILNQNPRQSPTSDDSSPSPPSNTDATSRRQSIHARPNDIDDASLKRKASSDDMQPGPSSKNQHTGLCISSPDFRVSHSLYQPTTQIQPKSPSRRGANQVAILWSVCPNNRPAKPSDRFRSRTNPVCSSARNRTEPPSVHSESARRSTSRM